METAHTFIAADGVAITYRRRPSTAVAESLPIVLIHGAASNMTRWSEFVGQTILASSRTLLRLDLRGHGQSLYRGPLGLEVWCDDIAGLLRDAGYQRAILMGHCLGANIAMMFAARYPQHSAGLVLVEPILRQALSGRLSRLRSMAALLRAVIAVIRFANRLGIYRRHLAGLDLQQLDAKLRIQLNNPGSAEFLERYYASPWQDLKIMPTANFFQDLLEVIRPLSLQAITVPFLAVLSTGRAFVDPDITAALLTNMPRGEVQHLEAKHWIPAEQPRAMQFMVEQWVKQRGDLR